MPPQFIKRFPGYYMWPRSWLMHFSLEYTPHVPPNFLQIHIICKPGSVFFFCILTFLSFVDAKARFIFQSTKDNQNEILNS